MSLFLSLGLPRGSVVKNPPANTGGLDLISGLGRSPGEWSGYLFQYCGLGNPNDRGAWWAIVHTAAKSGKQLNDYSNNNACHLLCLMKRSSSWRHHQLWNCPVPASPTCSTSVDGIPISEHPPHPKNTLCACLLASGIHPFVFFLLSYSRSGVLSPPPYPSSLRCSSW